MRQGRPFRSERFGPFRGRDTETTKLRTLLTGRAPIITVTGLPGVGKTRLVAHVLGDQAVWIDAATIDDTGDFDPVIERCAIQIGHDHHTDGPITVVIDGLERPQLIAPLADFIDDHPMLRVVITSRIHLTIRGAASLRLTPFELPTRAASLVATPHRWPAAQCFLDHATNADPDFHITHDNATAVLDLLKTTGGLPLAIELATTWLGTLPITTLAWTTPQPNQLNHGPLDLHPSQRNLAHTLQAAVSRIPDNARDVARAIAEFHGPAPLPAVAVVLGTDVTLDTVAELLAANLVWTADINGTPHITMLPLVAEELRNQRSDTTYRDRYLTWMCTLVGSLADSLGRSDNAVAFAALTPVVDGLPDVRRLFPPGDERAAEVTLALLPYWRLSAQYRESRRRIDAALAMVGAEHPLSPWLRVAAARAHRDCDDVAQARRVASGVASDESLPLPIRAVAAMELLDIRRMAEHTTEPTATAMSIILQALEVREDERVPVPPCVRRWVADLPMTPHMVEGDERLERADYDGARKAYERVEQLALGDDNVAHELWALGGLSEVHEASDARDANLDVLNRQMRTAASLGERTMWRLHSRIARTVALAAYGHHDEARRDAVELLGVADELESSLFIQQTHHVLGMALAEMGDADDARTAFRRALAIGEVVNLPRRTAYTLMCLALAAPPVGPDAATRSRLAAAAMTGDPGALDHWSKPWSTRAAAIDLTNVEPITVAEGIALALSALDDAPADAPAVVTTAGGTLPITAREREVLAMLADELSDREIASRLVVSVRTAEAHVGAILRKLGAHNRRDAARIAHQNGLELRS